MKKLLKLFSIVSLFFFTHAHSKNIHFERLSIGQGLSHNIVNCILQDHRGFMWFGTVDGLNRYDGYEFVAYNNEADNPNSLGNDYVYSICEDDSGILWIGTWGNGLDKFDFDKQQFEHYIHDPQNPNSISGNFITTIYTDRSGNLWIGTHSNGLNKLGCQDTRIVHYQHQPDDPTSLSDNTIRTIYEDLSGVLWIGTQSGGLNRFDPPNETFQHYQHQADNPHSIGSNCINFTYEDQSGRFWIGTDLGGLNLFDRKHKTFKKYRHDPNNPNSINDNYVHSIYEEPAGKLWLGTIFGGINIFDPVRECWTHILPDRNDPTCLSAAWVTSIYKDRSDVIWLGTYGGGLCRFNIFKEKFVHHLNEQLFQIVRNLDIGAIYTDQEGIIWIGTGLALHKLDRQKQTLTNFRGQDDRRLIDNEIWTIFKAPSGRLWLGTSQGVYIFDPQKQTIYPFTHYFPVPSFIDTSWVATIFEDRSGMIWLSSPGWGLMRFNWQTKQLTRYIPHPNNPNSLHTASIKSICEDENGNIWLGSPNDGISCFDRKSETFTAYIHHPHDPHSLNCNTIEFVFVDHTNRLWIGTDGDGLLYFDRTQNQFRQYQKQEGLPNNHVSAILEDDSGNLWLGTRKGLSKFNPATETFKNYEVRDGLTGWDFGPAFKAHTGEMFFGGTTGMNAFYPDSIKENPFIPEIVITDFRLFNKAVRTYDSDSPLPKHITECDEITLSYNQRVFSFEFAALHYGCPAKNEYAFQMEGYTTDWNYIGTRRFAAFTNLSPSQYTFRVKGANCDGIWNETGTSLRIRIKPPWWRTWLAYLSYLSLISGLSFSSIRFLTHRALLKKELILEHEHAAKLEALDRMKSRFFANISHEFRTPLTLILGPLEKLFDETSDHSIKKQYRLMLRNGRRLLRLINQLLDLSKIEAGRMTLKASPVNIVKLVKATVRFFTSWAERKRIKLRFKTTTDEFIGYVDQDKLENIISNILSNAFKFTPEQGEISVMLSVRASDIVEIVVADTGPGIPADRIDRIFDRFFQVDDSQTRAYEGTGIGLALTKELVELHHGEISVKNRIGDGEKIQGTIFTIRLPLGKEFFKPNEISDTPSEVDLKKPTGIEPETNTIPTATAPPPLNPNRQIILIVEDNTDVREYMQDFLKTDYQIIEATNGVEALASALEIIPDLIISDVMMAKMDGFEFCRKIKTDTRTCHIPVILLTARASGESKVEGLETGADDYLTKPFDVRELLVRVRNLIDQRQRLRERFSKGITVKPNEITITSMDEAFLQRAIDIVEKHIAESEFTTDAFAWEIGVSRMQLNRKLQALTNQSTHEFIRTIRLKRAAQLLAGGAGTVTEIAYDVGFNSLSHFAKAFREQFKQSPSEYAAEHVE